MILVMIVNFLICIIIDLTNCTLLYSLFLVQFTLIWNIHIVQTEIMATFIADTSMAYPLSVRKQLRYRTNDPYLPIHEPSFTAFQDSSLPPILSILFPLLTREKRDVSWWILLLCFWQHLWNKSRRLTMVRDVVTEAKLESSHTHLCHSVPMAAPSTSKHVCYVDISSGSWIIWRFSILIKNVNHIVNEHPTTSPSQGSSEIIKSLPLHSCHDPQFHYRYVIFIL